VPCPPTLARLLDRVSWARPAEEIPAWDEVSGELKPVLARQMECFAGFLEHTDSHIGRLIGALEDLGVLDDTPVCSGQAAGDDASTRRGSVITDAAATRS